MKKLYSILVLLALALAVHAQDRKNVQETVSDVVAAMPAQNSSDFATLMSSLSAAAPQSVADLASRLKPAGEGVRNAAVEYALQGLAYYASDPANAAVKAAVAKGFQEAESAQKDPYNKQLLASLLRMLGEYSAPQAAPALSLKEAKSLLKSGATHEKCLAACEIMQAQPAKALKTVASALKSDDRIFRNSVLSNATKLLGSTALVPLLTGKYKKLSDDAKVDVLNWFGNNKVSSVATLVNSAMEEGGPVAEAAIAAAGKIGSTSSVKSLLGNLGGPFGQQALTALKSFKGDIRKDVAEALSAKLAEGTDKSAIAGLVALASARKMKEVSPVIFSMLSSSDASLSSLAGSTLGDFVGTDDIARIGGLLGGATEPAAVVNYQNALNSALHTLSPTDKYSRITDLMKKTGNAANFYRCLAGTGTDAAVEDLAKASKAGDKSAFRYLCSIDNKNAAPYLLEAAKSASGEEAVPILSQYIELVKAYETDLDKRRIDMKEALSISDSPIIKKSALVGLMQTPTMKSFLLAGKYLSDPDKEVSYLAAKTVKAIATVTKEEINYDELVSYLRKAIPIFKSTGHADDDYAVNEIDEFLRNVKPYTPSALTAEEKRQGFEMLFDGTSLDKWQGDFEGYTPVNGSILVSAGYGATGNLYTKKEYRNFVYRFEFCFLTEGVNNGVGVRTPMGVDAAYDGMCEVQILDHDAEQYAGWLREYQVHGSVYGVIPAKRIVHKPLGEWSTEEIRVEGDRIKVTVNGQVIVDGNIRTACKGHNVAPDGSGKNPYTVDGRNHPGMFNRQGFISFCGHGSGLKIRNVRILDLGARK